MTLTARCVEDEFAVARDVDGDREFLHQTVGLVEDRPAVLVGHRVVHEGAGPDEVQDGVRQRSRIANSALKVKHSAIKHCVYTG